MESYKPKLYNLLYITKLFRINVTAFEKFCSSKVGRSNKRVQKGYTRKAIPLLNKVYFNTYLELKKKNNLCQNETIFFLIASVKWYAISCLISFFRVFQTMF